MEMIRSKLGTEVFGLSSLKSYFNEGINLCESMIKTISQTQMGVIEEIPAYDKYYAGLKVIVKELLAFENEVIANIKPLKEEIIEPLEIFLTNYHKNYDDFVQEAKGILENVQSERLQVQKKKTEYLNAANSLSEFRESLASLDKDKENETKSIYFNNQ